MAFDLIPEILIKDIGVDFISYKIIKSDLKGKNNFLFFLI